MDYCNAEPIKQNTEIVRQNTEPIFVFEGNKEEKPINPDDTECPTVNNTETK